MTYTLVKTLMDATTPFSLGTLCFLKTHGPPEVFEDEEVAFGIF